MFQINIISQKYVAERLLPRITEGGSVTFISSMGGLGWQRMYADLQGLIVAEGWEGQEAWYEAHVDLVDGDPNPYAVSKKALNSYVTKKCMDPAYVAKHIRVSTICPGMTNTGLTNAFNTGAGGGDAEAGAKALDGTFTAVWGGQNATPEQMGQPMVVLGSRISSYISGVNLLIDHGVSACGRATASWARARPACSKSCGLVIRCAARFRKMEHYFLPKNGLAESSAPASTSSSSE